MDKEEAMAWLMGKRSVCNSIPRDPWETWMVRSTQADAAMVTIAYWALKAHKEGLVSTNDNPDDFKPF